VTSPAEDSRLSVLTVNAFGLFGGAEKVAVDLHQAYLQRGIDSWLLLGAKLPDVPHVLQLPNDAYRSRWARALLAAARQAEHGSRRRKDAGWLTARSLRVLAEPTRYAAMLAGREDFEYPATAHLLDLPPTPPDVVHLHNLHGSYFDVRQLPALTSRVPAIATLHDAWLLTGHCAHPLDCTRWQTGCGDCPYPEMYVAIPRDASAENWRVKRDAVRRSRLRIATPSRWLMRMVEASGIAEALLDARIIPNGIDTTVFSPGSKSAARAALGLPQDREIVLFTARALADNPFKDYATLAQALPRVAEARPDVLLVAIGSEGDSALVGHTEHRTVPFVEDPAEVAQYYRAADVYVHAARAENLPLAIIEALACGTPVVASDVGGVPELVTDGETGLLVPVGDAQRLASAIVRVLDDENLREAMCAAGVERVSGAFTLERQVNAYLDWYGELV